MSLPASQWPRRMNCVIWPAGSCLRMNCGYFRTMRVGLVVRCQARTRSVSRLPLDHPTTACMRRNTLLRVISRRDLAPSGRLSGTWSVFCRFGTLRDNTSPIHSRNFRLGPTVIEGLLGYVSRRSSLDRCSDCSICLSAVSIVVSPGRRW